MNDLAGWFSNWERVQNIAAGAVFFYVAIVLLVRLLGKRTTGQMNNFDWIITVAVGSLAASGILLSSVAIVDALIAIVILAALQWLTTWLVQRSDLASKAIKDEPTLLVHKGRFLRDAMRQTRVAEEEILSALRAEGIMQVAGANWVVLETNGELSIIARDDTELDEADTLCDVHRPGTLPEPAPN